MKHHIHLLLLLCPLFVLAQSEEEKILNIELKRTEAVAAQDHAYLASIYDDQFHGVTATGKVIDKANLLEIFKTNNPHVVFATEELKTTLFGTTAVVTGKLLSKSKNSGHVLGQARYIHVYIRQNDAWKILEAQATIIH